MKLLLTFIQQYIKLLSIFNVRYCADLALKLFMRTKKKKVSLNEAAFYDTAHKFVATYFKGEIRCYEMGDPNGDLIFLVHGWESNAGSLAGIAHDFAHRGYHVILMDLPAHGKDKGSHTNLFECKEALKAVINRVRPANRFSLLSHSFGSMVSAFALSELPYEVDKLIFLTSPNKVDKIFNDFKSLLKLPEPVFSLLIDFVEGLFDERIEDLVVQERALMINKHSFDIIHDEFDRVVPLSDSLDIQINNPGSKLHVLEKTGHYRMLWNQNVREIIQNLFSSANKAWTLDRPKRLIEEEMSLV